MAVSAMSRPPRRTRPFRGCLDILEGVAPLIMAAALLGLIAFILSVLLPDLAMLTVDLLRGPR